MEKLFKVLIIYCCVSTVVYFQNKAKTTTSPRNEGGENNEYEVALDLQKEWNNAGNFSKQRRIIIHSNWRSGSSFLGGIFESSPGNS